MQSSIRTDTAHLRKRELCPYGRTQSLPTPLPSCALPPSLENAVYCPCGRSKFFIFLFFIFYFFIFLFFFIFYFFLFFLVVVAGLKREKKISVFGFQSPRSPSSPCFAGEAARRRRFFRPSSPSHPSKLYSSLGWLNSKVPKPFSPFSLRLIDVDGF
jgi:hypothetical protein